MRVTNLVLCFDVFVPMMFFGELIFIVGSRAPKKSQRSIPLSTSDPPGMLLSGLDSWEMVEDHGVVPCKYKYLLRPDRLPWNGPRPQLRCM